MKPVVRRIVGLSNPQPRRPAIACQVVIKQVLVIAWIVLKFTREELPIGVQSIPYSVQTERPVNRIDLIFTVLHLALRLPKVFTFQPNLVEHIGAALVHFIRRSHSCKVRR